MKKQTVLTSIVVCCLFNRSCVFWWRSKGNVCCQQSILMRFYQRFIRELFRFEISLIPFTVERHQRCSSILRKPWEKIFPILSATQVLKFFLHLKLGLPRNHTVNSLRKESLKTIFCLERLGDQPNPSINLENMPRRRDFEAAWHARSRG